MDDNDRRYQLFRKHYVELANELEGLDVGIGYQLRKEKAIHLLRKHG